MENTNLARTILAALVAEIEEDYPSEEILPHLNELLEDAKELLYGDDSSDFMYSNILF